MSYDWITWLIYGMMFMLIFVIFAQLWKALSEFWEKRKSPEERLKSINLQRYKEILSATKLNRTRRPKIGWVWIRPSGYFMPRRLGKYAGHIADKRLLVLAIRISRIPWKRPIILLIPYSLGDEKLVPPLTTENIYLNINSIARYDRWWIPVLRHDSKYTQEDIIRIVSTFLHADFTTDYGTAILPAQIVLSPTQAANLNPSTEKYVVYQSAVANAPEEKGGEEE